MERITRKSVGQQVEIISRGKESLSLVPAQKLKITNARPTAQGGVSDLNAHVANSSPAIRQLSFTLDNSAGAAAATFMVFDALGVNANILGGAYTDPTSATGIGVDAINDAIKSEPLLLTGFNYRITTGAASQFSQNMFTLRAAADGSQNRSPLLVSGDLRNTQFNDKILTIVQEILVDKWAALQVTVEANTTVVLDFYIGGQYNAF